MALYLEYSTRIYSIYLNTRRKIFTTYSVRQCCMDVNGLSAYPINNSKRTCHDHKYRIYAEGVVITARCGNWNEYAQLQIAMNIVAKHVKRIKSGLRIARNWMKCLRRNWGHRPLISGSRKKDTQKKLEEYGLYTMGDIFKMFHRKANNYTMKICYIGCWC